MKRRNPMGNAMANVKGHARAVLLASALAPMAMLAGCSGGSDSTSPLASAESASTRTRPGASSAEPFAFFVATRSFEGYRISAVNGAPFACGARSAASWCAVTKVDLSALDLPSADATALLDQIGQDPSSPEVLFVGSVAADALAVVEVWKAPAALPLEGTLLAVSHQPQQALVVNEWTEASVGTLDFSGAPEATYCTYVDAGTECAPSLLPVETDAPTPAGILVAGRMEGGKLRVEQYFLAISVGYVQEADGYSYCKAGETVCGSGACSPSGNCLHWGGRGLPPVYVRSSVASFDAWLVTTGQLQSSELPSPPPAN